MFAVVDTDNIALLGKNTCIRLGLVKRIYAINSPGIKQLVLKYDDVFKGIGCLQVKHHIELKEEAHEKFQSHCAIDCTKS